MSDTIPGTRPTREGAEEVRSDKRTWTLPERQWVEYLLKKLQLYSSTDPDSCHASKLLNLGSLLKACGLELPAADPAVGCEPLKVKLADTSGPGTESGAPEIWREGGPKLTQRNGPATEPAKTEQELWEVEMQRWRAHIQKCEEHIGEAADLHHKCQQAFEKAFEREQQLVTRMEQLLEKAELLLVRIVARQSGAPTEADIKRTQELKRERGWEENKATVGTIPTEPIGNPLIPSGSTSSFPQIKREFAQGGHIPASQMPKPDYTIEKTHTDASAYPGAKPGPETASARIRQLEQANEEQAKIIERLNNEAADYVHVIQGLNGDIRQIEQARKVQAMILEDLNRKLSDLENANNKRRQLGDRLIELAKDLKKWRNECPRPCSRCRSPRKRSLNGRSASTISGRTTALTTKSRASGGWR